jgi:fungal STAND N-terminal Goodbye domain
MSESSTAQATSSTSNIQSIIDDALSEYARVTGIDLSNNPFATTLEQSNSPDAILQLLLGRENAFREYRDGDRRLTSCLTPAVKVLQAFSGIMGQAAGMVSHTCKFR